MSKYVFVGDLHGKWEEVEKALAMDGTIIFIGDYLDSFDRSIGDQRKTLELVLDAIVAKKAMGLFGNHELSYLVPYHRCSGYNRLTQVIVDELKERMLNLLLTHIHIEDNWLITHAGLHPDIVDAARITNKSIDDVTIEDDLTPFHWIGRSRGGYAPVGGIWWCDFNDEFKPIPGINQIFGHSSYGGKQGIRKLETENSVNYCIDCLDHHPGMFLKLEI